MRSTKAFVAVALTAPFLMLSCAKEPAPESAPPPDIATAAPAGANVYEVTAHWDEALCANATDWTFDVPRDTWIAMPVTWIAVDEATARANWKHMSYRIWLGDRELDIPEGVQMEVTPVHVECANRTIDGAGVWPLVFLPPVTAERQYREQLLFNDDVNDGWGTYAKGTDVTGTATLRPAG